MVGLWLLCLVGVGAAAGSALPADRANSPCQPGTVWMADDGCNTCFCLESGMPGCTLMACSAINPAADKSVSGFSGEDMKPLPLPNPDEEVKAHSVNGDAQKPEPESLPKPEPKSVEERSGVSCVEGQEWQEDCNSCFCLGDGGAACTMMACLPETRSTAPLGYARSTTTGTVKQVRSTARQVRSTVIGKVKSAASPDCVRECPADCGSARGEDGCLTCDCDISPFFGVLPVPKAAAAAAAAGGDWYGRTAAGGQGMM